MKEKMDKVYQKFYSCINLLSKVTTDEEFIDNISYIDAFLNEFRSITLVIQKQFDDTESQKKYLELRDEFIKPDLKLKKLVDLRNESTHEEPFDLIIKVDALIYLNHILTLGLYCGDIKGETLTKKQIEKKISNFLKSLKSRVPEIYFSYDFKFIYNGEKIDIIDLAEYGINKMFDFLIKYEKTIFGNTKQFKNIKEKISNKIIKLFENRLRLNVNGVYNTSSKKIYTSFPKSKLISVDKNGKPIMGFKKGKINSKFPMLIGNTIMEKFKSFSMYQVIIYKMTHELSPVFLIVYNDNECELICDIVYTKADIYYTIHNIVEKINEGNVKSIFVCQQMISSKKIEDFANMTHDERMEKYDSESLAFSLIDKNEECFSLLIPCELIENNEDIISLIDKKEYEFTNYSIKPLIDAIKK